ncbi:glycosyltransferase family 4 protein [Priestia megaterium]|uniref:glycosyltransferase family 4 protein n=1 Tax=Priestia megaterium TaxID=1404 RepID=UPI00228201DF|nr:glycosyltransferase family 4 protein [Priestia megaterium]MCY9017531.1 glycosyltransferase family 4 protein [Priestia megaterium]
MIRDLIFPYPYIIEKMDEYYKPNLPSVKIREDYRTNKSPQKRPSKKKLTILIATFWDYPHIGGLSNYITELSKGLRKQGHKVDVISPNLFPSATVKNLREDITPKLKEFFLRRYGSYDKKILSNSRLLYVYERMLQKIDLEKYDIFHAQDIFTANILGRFNANYNKPLFFTPHGMFTFKRLKFNLMEKGSIEETYYKELERKAIEFASQLIILSDSFRDSLTELGAKHEKMTTVITGINYPEKYYKKKLEPQEKLVITCVARLGPRKGHNYLLSALSHIRQYTNNVEVLIVGDGEMRETLEKQVHSLDLPIVNFLGSRDDVPYILSKTDIFVLPTINDSLPIAIIEAMHSGTAIISTNCGGIPEIVKHGKTGIVVEPGDTEELAQALRFFIVNKQARDKASTNAFNFAKTHLTTDGMIRKIESIYNKF